MGNDGFQLKHLLPGGKRTAGVAGFWKDDRDLLKAATKVRDAGYKKFDAITPFPVHGMDEATGIKRSFLPWITFIMGAAGTTVGLSFQWFVAAWDWPLNVGGKPFFSWPAFVPVIFELTVLLGGLSTVAGLIFMCRLPQIEPPIIDPGLTDDKFALFVPDNEAGYSADKVEKLFKELGATDVRRVVEY